MGDEYQNRRDIDKIYDDLYDQINGSLNVLKFDKDSEFKNISSKEDGSDVGTIDAIINYYQLTEKGGGGGGDLSDYYTKTEINTILSSYVTNETLDDYALKSELFSGSYNDLDDVPSTFPPSSHSHNWDSVTGKPSTFPPSTHNHDDIYYTETEIDTILSSYATSSEVTSRLAEYVKLSYATATFSPKSHNHDDRYYTESEIDSQMYDKSDRWHTHSTDYISDENVSDYTEIYKHTLPSTPAKLSHDLYAIDTELGCKVDTNSVVTTWSSTVSDTNIASEKLVKDTIDALPTGGSIDDALSDTSTNAVQNKVVKSAIDGKAPLSHRHNLDDISGLSSLFNHYPQLRTTLLDLIYPVGAIYETTKNTTICPIQSTLGGTWVKIEGRFLLASGTTSGTSKTYISGSTDGYSNAVPITHTHTQDAHTHTTGDTSAKYFYTGGITIGATASKKAHTNSSSGVYLIYSNATGDIAEKTSIQSVTPTINAPTDAESGVGRNMPPYLVVNIWKRTE